jgi:predicted O-linked N-acetylglucosamine transferase (SPINDLY family)
VRGGVNPGRQRAQILSVFETAGIRASRLEFVPIAPRRDYLKLYDRADIALDTFPYNGHTTSLDALWMGVPVISRIGETVASRAGWSQLTNLQLRELVARSDEEFVSIAKSLAADLPRLTSLRQMLRRRMEESPLMDAPRFARGVEAVFREAWQRWCAATAP